MPDFYFHSSIFDYWRFVHSAWLKFGMRKGGNGAFNYTRKKFKSYSYVEYNEDENRDPEGIIFWDDDYKFPILAVFAEAISTQKVKLTVHFEKEAAKKIGRSALARWNKMLALMEEDGRLEYPVARNNSKMIRGPQPRIIDNLKRLRKIRLEAINNGRPIPKKTIAREDAGSIAEMTWKRYDLELWKRWNDKNYK